MITLPAIWSDGTQQVVWRSILQATGFPGRVQDLAGALDDAPAWLGVLATFADRTQTVSDPDGLISQENWELLGAPPAPFDEARFIVADGATPPRVDSRPMLGTIYRPEHGATLILRSAEIGAGPIGLSLSGPGIADQTALQLDGVAGEWFKRRAAWCSDFPLGVDLVLCDDARIAALPRTTHVVIG